MHANLLMIPHESTLFSNVCKTTALGIDPSQVTAKAPAAQPLEGVPWFVAPHGISGGDHRFESHWFYAISWDIPRKSTWNL